MINHSQKKHAVLIFRVFAIGTIIFLIGVSILIYLQERINYSPNLSYVNFGFQTFNSYVVFMTGIFVAWYTFEAHRLRIDSERPLISVIYNSSVSNLILENIGKGAAINMSIAVERPDSSFEDISILLETKNLKYESTLYMNQTIDLIAMYQRSLSLPSQKDRGPINFIVVVNYEDIYKNFYATSVRFVEQENRLVIVSTEVK